MLFFYSLERPTQLAVWGVYTRQVEHSLIGTNK